MRRALFALLFLVLASAARAQSTPGLVPLTDMGSGTYRGYDGGLYGGGMNVPPPAHFAAALSRAAEIVPRDASGMPDPNGWIGFIAVGLSNTTHEFGAFERDADLDTTRNARVVLMDTGFGGMSADVIANPAAPYWTTMSQRITAMGLTAAQVQVAWLKEAFPMPANDFPVHARALRDSMAKICRNLHDKFPNLKLVYVSSRIYGGYQGQGGTNPEPQAFESGYSVRWLIEQQIAGDPTLNHDPGAGPVRAPLLLWGPYLWANGTTPRADGLTWPIADFEADRVHPAPSGEQKVSGLLRAFFAAEPTAASWWPATAGARLRVFDATDDAYVSAANPGTNYGAVSPLYASQGSDVRSIYVKFDTHALADSVLLAKLSLRVLTIGGGQLRRLDDPTWNEGTLTFANAPAFGPLLATLPQSSRDGTYGVNVTPTLLANIDHLPGFALTTPTINPTDYLGKEGGHPPRLVLVVASPSVAAVPDHEPAPPEPGWLRSLGPNPAAGPVRFALVLPRACSAELAVFAVDGRRVRVLSRGYRPAGEHTLAWDGRDERGEPAAPGLYLLRLRAGAHSEALRLVRVR